MIKELIIKKLKEEIRTIENNKFNMQESYVDGKIDGLKKAIKFIRTILE